VLRRTLPRIPYDKRKTRIAGSFPYLRVRELGVFLVLCSANQDLRLLKAKTLRGLWQLSVTPVSSYQLPVTGFRLENEEIFLTLNWHLVIGMRSVCVAGTVNREKSYNKSYDLLYDFFRSALSVFAAIELR
jgi:hypothetical protein